MWSPQTSQGFEVKKCRHRLISLCRGAGLDLGCGDEKIVESAVGIDIGGKAADINLDLSANDSLAMFSDNYFDYVFSSHCLEDFEYTEAILKQWWRIIKPGGHLMLYCPDPDYYPRVGTAGCNPNHQKDLYWQDVWKIIKGFGGAKQISASRHNESNEYSWQLVAKKKNGFLARPLEMLLNQKKYGQIAIPRVKRTNKECLIIRYGALGDAVWTTSVLSQLKKDGWYIVYNCTPYSAQVLRENPYIDEFLIQESGAIPDKELDDYWAEISKGFEKVINFTGSVEGSLLKREGSDEYAWPHNKRHKQCNVNYMDKTMAVAGYPQSKSKGRLPELHFSDTEEGLARIFRNINKDKFLILWSLSGSSYHKIYPWTEYVAGSVNDELKDARIITVGDMLCKQLEWQLKNTVSKSGEFTVRQSMILTKYVDLVIGTETGILNAASCYDTPKIVFLSHSSEENLTKYWNNCTAMSPDNCKCYPCHRLIFSNSCPKGKKAGAALCAENIDPRRVFNEIKKIYKEWQNG